MYWPIGNPKVYSEVTEGRHVGRDISNDGVTSGDHNGPSERDENTTGGENILGLRITRNGHFFVTWTASSFTVWQSKPTVVVARVARSPESIKHYGANVTVLIRPDSAIFVVQTGNGFLITYTLSTEHGGRVYQGSFYESGGIARRRSSATAKVGAGSAANLGPGEGTGVANVSMRFRMVIKVDAGIAKALALDDGLVVATEKPAAVQSILWSPDKSGSQTSTELLTRMSWVDKDSAITEMIHDRPMNLSTWITSDGKAYAVQRHSVKSPIEGKSPKKAWQGYCFHTPDMEGSYAVKAAINARFSLIAIGCANGDILIYNARDYAGHIPLSHKLSVSSTVSSPGTLAYLSYSPDGYCMFAGFSNGWMMWSVYGKPTGSSFNANRVISENNDERWFLGIRDCFWLGGGSQLVLASNADPHFWMVDMARSAVAGCFSPANVTRSLLQTNSGIMVYRGYDVPDVSAISAESGLWYQVQVPAQYLLHQWPIRTAVTSADGRYVAVAGRRGLAHYSVTSGRWKTFDDPTMEDEFTVRGGMCWYQHILIAAVESNINNTYQVRMYSRELALDNGKMLHAVQLGAPIVLITPSGDDSLLVYTYENILYHYMIATTAKHMRLIQVGQIALHGIIRAPLRVRAVSWILPEDQLEHGDPSQDVGMATVLFLVDGKLVLLNPTTSEQGELKYEMRILANNVEHYALMRDQPSEYRGDSQIDVTSLMQNGYLMNGHNGQDLKDSIWYFDGTAMKVWPDVQDVLASASLDFGRELPPCVDIPIDFYPLSAVFAKGILFGIESEILQRRNVNFSTLRFVTRTHLFLPALLKYHLSRYNSPAALHLSHRYRTLDYFPHALEVLLHDVLDEEVDAAEAEQRLLPNVLSFLSTFPEYLDIIVQCTRKTEVRSWRTLFAHLPPPQELFEESLAKGSLKTAGGYLLVLHTFEELSSSSEQLIRLLRRAKEEQDWELCKELARFLMALDPSGATLRDALEVVDLIPPTASGGGDRLALPTG
ncbi:RIC1-domain-containing protein [Rhizodiscina lignyota]|uniref:RIC1-domain-containing protein n=1 Tax=Rhizodiscina lignyota TaxID=1504668 RepID=A0A9P4I739_9PEZI|nr:RIC1-domain-containing protein [Rhizodiscina lignyota]